LEEFSKKPKFHKISKALGFLCLEIFIKAGFPESLIACSSLTAPGSSGSEKTHEKKEEKSLEYSKFCCWLLLGVSWSPDGSSLSQERGGSNAAS